MVNDVKESNKNLRQRIMESIQAFIQRPKVSMRKSLWRGVLQLSSRVPQDKKSGEKRKQKGRGNRAGESFSWATYRIGPSDRPKKAASVTRQELPVGFLSLCNADKLASSSVVFQVLKVLIVKRSMENWLCLLWEQKGLLGQNCPSYSIGFFWWSDFQEVSWEEYEDDVVPTITLKIKLFHSTPSIAEGLVTHSASIQPMSCKIECI